LFPENTPDKMGLRKRSQVFHTLRRLSDTQAIEMKISQGGIDMVTNTWEAVEKAKGAQPYRPMQQHYADVVLFVDAIFMANRCHVKPN
jgi:hypothetical protein